MSLVWHYFLMNRTDRLYAVREELRRAGKAGRTAEALASTFQVSLRTIKRDIAALQHSGFPVWARPGPGGGYAVDPQATLPPVNFTETEIAGLAAAVASHRGQPFELHARGVLTKALGLMDRGARERAEALTSRIWVDVSETRATARVRHALERALSEMRVLSLGYLDRHGKVTARKVDPILLAHTRGHWYLVGHCRLAEGVRWFRVDRVSSANLTSERAAAIPVDSIGAPPSSAAALTDI